MRRAVGTAGVEFQLARKLQQRGDTFGYTSELFALDAKVNWKMTDNFRLSAGVDNLTNNKAWVYHPYPQRSFLVEAGWTL